MFTQVTTCLFARGIIFKLSCLFHILFKQVLFILLLQGLIFFLHHLVHKRSISPSHKSSHFFLYSPTSQITKFGFTIKRQPLSLDTSYYSVITSYCLIRTRSTFCSHKVSSSLYKLYYLIINILFAHDTKYDLSVIQGLCIMHRGAKKKGKAKKNKKVKINICPESENSLQLHNYKIKQHSQKQQN